MALFSFRHSVRTFSDRRTAEARAAKYGQTAAHLRYITRPQAARAVLRKRLPEATDAQTGKTAEREAAKRRGRVCERFIIALPVEATLEQREALVRAFCEEITKGIAGYVAAIHDKTGNDKENPHAHIVAFDVQVKTGGRGRPRSTIGMAQKDAVQKTAALWTEQHNRLMRGWGYGPESQITHLSYAARGVDRIAQIHEGAASRAIAGRGGKEGGKPEWRHVDQGHSRAAANLIIREINVIRETGHEQIKQRVAHRLGRGDEHDRAEFEDHSENVPAHCGRACRDIGEPTLPFGALVPLGKASRRDQDAANAAAVTPPFLARASSPTAPPLAADRRVRRGGGLRRIFRELLMLRDTLRLQLLRGRGAGIVGCEGRLEIAPVLARKEARQVERD